MPPINEHSRAGARGAGPGWAGLHCTEEEPPNRAATMCFLTREYPGPAAAPPSPTAPITPTSPAAPVTSKPPLKITLPIGPTAPTAPRPPTVPHYTQSTHKPTLPVAPAAPTHPGCPLLPSAPVRCGEHWNRSFFGVSAPSPVHAAATIPRVVPVAEPTPSEGSGLPGVSGGC